MTPSFVRKRRKRPSFPGDGQRQPQSSQAVLSALEAHHRALEKKLPAELQQVESDLAATEKKIARLLDQVEEGQAAPEINQRVGQRRAEKEALLKRRQDLERLNRGHVEAPTEEWVREQFGHLETLLRSGVPAAAHALRDLVGEVILTEVERPGYHRNFLRGKFTLSMGSLMKATGTAPRSVDDEASSGGSPQLSEEIVIDFCEPDRIDALADRVKELWDAGRRYHQIAAEIPCSLKAVRKALKHWFGKRGLPLPDGRKCHAGRWPARKLPAALVERVMALEEQGLEQLEIAQVISHSRGYVAKLRRQWHEERGLPVPDRRKARKKSGDQAA